MPSRKATPRKKTKTAGPRLPSGANLKPAAPAIESWSDVDRLLHRMTRIDAQADALVADVNRRVQAVKDKAAPRHIRLAAERAALEAEIEAFAKGHKADFGGDRSVRLAHGRVGWRAATHIRFTVKADEVVSRLENRGLDMAIMVTKRASKDVLDTFEDDVLADLGVKRRRTDTFYVELEQAHLGRPGPSP